ncbi:hypothetical protein O181_067141 [Austropuccinia psidii MF-1]|uniref:Retrovirus-related Pol polyprotein from transposon TNT 1-94-like beta-barrel domain-containing protein n=1 Tax=Austropuccinia psidii MF-1 TaxID=1389203 RepID=A0A9Q3I2T0_9BASI|nr:hypothetical protein [Austropuccinia psidii MF-1]
MYLGKIFSTQLLDNQIKDNMSFILENTLHLFTLISGLTISPEDLIDSVIAMGVIINLPERFKTTMEVWLGKCKVEKTYPSLDDTWEVMRNFLQRDENNHNPNNQALIASKTNSNTKQYHQQKRKPKGDYPKCAPGWHNPLTRHDKSEFNFLKRDKNKKRSQKPIKSLIASTNKPNYNSIILDLGATTSMFNNPKIFTKISKLTQTIELADGSTILASRTGTVRIKLSHCFLDLSDCLLVENLLYNIISLGQILKPNYKLTSYKNKTFQLLDQNSNLIIKGSFECGNFEFNTENKRALTTVSHSNQSLTLNQATGHPSPEYLKKMFPKANVQSFLCNSCNLCKITKCPFKRSFPLPQ